MPRSRRLDATFRSAARSLRIESLEERRVLSATPELLTDVGSNPDSFDSNPTGFVEVGDLVYFSAQPSNFLGIPPQTWVTNGTTNATRLLSDFMPGNLLVGGVAGNVAGTLYFSASDSGTFGYRLWKWGGIGSEPTPVLSADGQRIAASTPLAEIDGVWYFGAGSAGFNPELWRTDGTQAGTFRVKALSATVNNAGSIDSKFLNVGGSLFFFANDGAHGNELWRSDGTEAGTILVRDVNPGIASGALSNSQAAVVDNLLYFTASDQQSNWELWRSDGSESGTYRVKDIRDGANGSIPSRLTNVGGTLFFSAVDDASGAPKLWKSDGTGTGTVRVLAASSVLLSNPFDLTEMNGKLYFGAAGGLWRSDGTQAGTQQIRQSGPPQLPVGIPTPYDGHSDVIPGNRDNIVNLNGTLYFVGNGSGYTGLWKYDDQSTGATLVLSKDNAGLGSTYTFSTLQYLTVAGDKLFFAGDSTNHGNEPWVSDGTTAGTVLLKDVTGAGSTSGVNYLTNVNGTLFFSGNAGNYPATFGRGWWTSNGTLSGTTSYAPITGATNNYSLLGSAGGLLYYKAKGVTGSDWELWRTDGTVAGTFRAKDIRPGTSGGLSNAFTRSIEMNGELYFVANDGVHGFELWRSDGTEAGTTMVADVFAGDMNGLSNLTMANVGGTLYFVGNDGASGNALWKTDGTAVGTSLVRTFVGWTPTNLYNGNGTLYFGAGDAEQGLELWKSDGTAAGTVMVKDIAPGNSLWQNDPPGFANIGDTIYFVANDGVTGLELWKSDGMAAGTMLVKDIRTDGGALLSRSTRFTVVGNTLYFYANDGVHGAELWKSDGTETGTALVKDIRPGSSSSNSGAFANPVNVGGILYFSATDGVNGAELWRSDGTEAGTYMVRNINAVFSGSGGSDLGALTNVNGRLYFTANDGVHGAEMWMLSPDEAAMEDGDYDQNGVTDGADFLKWQRAFGTADVTNDGDADGTVGISDLTLWADNFGEPAAAAGEVSDVAALTAVEESGDVEGFATSAGAEVAMENHARDAARDALFAAGDFSRLCAAGDEPDAFRQRWRRRR